MNTLTFDTATEIEHIEISVNGNITEFTEYTGHSHSRILFENFTSLFSRAGIKPADLDIVGVGIGPGSFTGVRIAVSTARMFAQICRIPLVGMKSQEIFAASLPSEVHNKVLVAFDAKKKRVFAGLYGHSGDTLREIIAPGDYSPEDILDRLDTGDNLACIGDGCGKYLDIIERYSARNGFLYSFLENFMPSGGHTSRMLLDKYNLSPGMYSDYNMVTPFYARKPDAEIIRCGG